MRATTHAAPGVGRSKQGRDRSGIVLIAAFLLLVPLLLLRPAGADAGSRSQRSLDSRDAGVDLRALAGNDRGDVLAAWRGGDRPSRADRRVRIRWIKRSGKLGKRRTLSPRRGHRVAGGPTVAVHPRRRASVAWLLRRPGTRAIAPSSISLTTVDRSGQPLRETTIEAKEHGFSFIQGPPALATAPNGTGVLVWTDYDYPASFGPTGPAELRWQRLGPTGRPRGPIQSTETSLNESATLDAVVDDRGWITVISSDGNFDLLRISPDERAESLREIAEPERYDTDSARLGVDRDGVVTAAWLRADSDENVVALRFDPAVEVIPFGVAFGSRSGYRLSDLELAVAGSGDSFLVWAQKGRNKPGNKPRKRVVAASVKPDGDAGFARRISKRGNEAISPDIGLDLRGRPFSVFERIPVKGGRRVQSVRFNRRNGKILEADKLGRGTDAIAADRVPLVAYTHRVSSERQPVLIAPIP